jgi:hypothetical protein
LLRKKAKGWSINWEVEIKKKKASIMAKMDMNRSREE